MTAIEDVSFIIRELETLTSIVHRMTQTELFACQRRFATLLQALRQATTSPQTTPHVTPEKSSLVKTQPSGNFLTDTIESASRVSDASMVSFCTCFSNEICEIASVSQGAPHRSTTEEISELCRACCESGMCTNAVNTMPNSSFRSILIVPVLRKGAIIGVLLAVDKFGANQFSGRDECTLCCCADLLGERLSNEDLKPPLVKRNAVISRESSQVSPRFINRIFHLPKKKPQWNATIAKVIRYPLSFADCVFDIAEEIQSAKSLQKVSEERLQVVISEKAEIQQLLASTQRNLDDVKRELSSLKQANHRLMKSSFLTNHSPTPLQHLPDCTSQKIPRWNSAVSFKKIL